MRVLAVTVLLLAILALPAQAPRGQPNNDNAKQAAEEKKKAKENEKGLPGRPQENSRHEGEIRSVGNDEAIEIASKFVSCGAANLQHNPIRERWAARKVQKLTARPITCNCPATKKRSYDRQWNVRGSNEFPVTWAGLGPALLPECLVFYCR